MKELGIYKLIKRILSILICGITIFPSAYTKQVDIRLSEALRIAVGNNHELKLQRLNLQKAEAAVKEAKGNAFPKLDFIGNYYYFLDKPVLLFPDFQSIIQNVGYGILFKEGILTYDPTKFVTVDYSKMSFGLKNQFESKIQISQIVFNSTVFRVIGASKIYLNVAKSSYNSTLSNLISNVKKAFFSALFLKEVYSIYEESLQNAQENLALIASMHSKGLVSDFDLMQAEVQVENLKPIVSQYKLQYENALNSLKLLLNISPLDSINPVGELTYEELDYKSIEDLLSSIFQNNWELRTLQHKLEIDNEYIELYNSEYYPSLVAFGNYSFAGQSEKSKSFTYSQSMVGVQLSLNLFNGFQTKSRVQQAKINYSQTQEQINFLKAFLTKQLKEKLDNLELSKQKYFASQKNVELATKAYEIAKVKYREGTAIQLELRNSELELRQAKINLKQSIYEILIIKSEIENLLGETDYEG